MTRVSRRTRTGVVMAAGLLAGTALTGCGNEEGGSTAEPAADGREDAAEVVRTAHEKTVAAGTAKMTLKVQAGSDGRQQAVTGDGAIDLADGTSDLTIRLGGETIRQRVVDQALYQKLPESLRSRVSDGKPWIKVDLREAAGRIDGVSGLQITDPAQSVDYARALSDDEAALLGKEKVNGVDTTHYRVVVDVEELAGDDTAQGERLRQQLGESLPMHLWVDGQDRIRRQQFEINVKGPGDASAPARKSQGPEPEPSERTQNATVRTVIEFSDFGTPVKVSPPPAGQTEDVTDKLVQASGKSSSNG